MIDGQSPIVESTPSIIDWGHTENNNCVVTGVGELSKVPVVLSAIWFVDQLPCRRLRVLATCRVGDLPVGELVCQRLVQLPCRCMGQIFQPSNYQTILCICNYRMYHGVRSWARDGRWKVMQFNWQLDKSLTVNSLICQLVNKST